MIPERVLSRPRLKDSFYKSVLRTKKKKKNPPKNFQKNSKWMKVKYDDNNSSMETINKEIRIIKPTK